MASSKIGKAIAVQLADVYFAADGRRAIRPNASETARIQWANRERPSSDVVTNDRPWPASSADPRTDTATLERLERPRHQSSAADQALVALTEHDFLEDDLVADLALALSKLK